MINLEPINSSSGVALVGAGFTSRHIYDFLVSQNIKVELVCDSNELIWGRRYYKSALLITGLKALRNYPGDVLVVCAGGYHLQRSLTQLGVKNLNYYYNYHSSFQLFSSWQNTLDIKNFKECFGDEHSKLALQAIYNAAVNRDFEDAAHLVTPRPYFGESNFQIEKGERIVELGAYRGYQYEYFDQTELNDLEIFVAVEPNESNNVYLNNPFSRPDLNLMWRKKLKILNCVISSDFGRTILNSNEISARKIVDISDSEGDTQMIPLDSLSSFSPTIICMDIEGDEMEALNSCPNILSEHRTRFAISTYHNDYDLMKLFDFFKSSGRQYKFKFRLHDYGFMDQVLYVEPV